MSNILTEPFLQYGFMRHALAACIALSLSFSPLGTFLILRRMSLVGDSMSHAILPGAALAFVFFGIAIWPMAAAGFIAGLAIALASGTLARLTKQREDASFAAIYLISLAGGVLLISLYGSPVDLMHLLFGNVLGIDNESLVLIMAVASITLISMAALYRALAVESFDPGFLQSTGSPGAFFHLSFMALAVLNLVAGFQALGTLMALGLMILPAAAAMFWTSDLDRQILLSAALSLIASYAGLLLSFYADLPSGPAIVLTAGFIYLTSSAIGTEESLRTRFLLRQHLTG